MKHVMRLDEGERQMMLMALAHLAVERPGWDDTLQRLAKQLDNEINGRPQMYDEFRKMHRTAVVAERKSQSG
jgi:hypothetical protein